MPEPHPAARTRRVTAVALVAAAAWGLVVAVLVGIVPAAQSSPSSSSQPPARYSGSALAPEVVARVVVETAAQARRQIRWSRTLMVFGDSVTARYNDRSGDREQGFWSMLAHELGARPQTRAEGGAGFVNPGLVGCVGSTFADQLARRAVAQTVARAGAVVIEGGRTDTQTCRKGGGYDLVPHREVRRAVEAFMAEVRRLRADDTSCTVVVVPWGPAGLMENRDRITAVVRQAATRHGFTFVDTLGLLTEATTIEDRVHPTRAGNKDLTRAILEQSDVEGCFS